MRTSVLSLVAAASIVSALSSAVVPAPKVNSNPAGAAYVATLPIKETSPLRGSITAVSGPNGEGVKFAIAFSGLPATGGPFTYHIHAKPVVDGNCTSAAGHLDPYKRGDEPSCDASKPETCEVGDLSGKHGKITMGSEFAAEYVDPYASTDPKNVAFFGNLSFVLHLANKTRIGCANFVMQGGHGNASYPAANATVLPGVPCATGTSAPRPTATGVPVGELPAGPSHPAQFTGAAAKVFGATGALLAAAAVLVL